jgi:two-component system, cell cycle sensor histidine kinase and response regulator CckA
LAENTDRTGAAGAEPDIYRLAFEHAHDLISVLDPDGRVVYASPSHEAVLGYTPDEMVGTSPLDLVYPDDREIAADALAADGGLSSPIRMRHRDGRWLIVEGRTTAIPGDDGAPRMLLSVSRDVTARTRAERRRDAQYAVTRVLAGATSLSEAARSVLHTVCERLDWDTGVLWRAEGDELHRVASCPASTDRGERELAEQVRRTGEPAWQPVDGRSAIAVPVGTWGVLTFSGPKFRLPDPDRLSVFASFGAQLWQYIERAQAEQALDRSRRMLSAVVDGTSDAVFVKDVDGRYLLINDAGAEALGQKVADVIGRDDAAVMAPEAAAEIMARDRTVMESRETVVAEERVETDHGTRLFLSTKSAYLDDEGHVLGLIGISHDVTERRRLEAELQQAQKMEAVGRLAGGVAHDFNNILSVIRGFSDLARKHLDSGQTRMDDWLRHVSRATEQGTALTRQLLAISRRQPLETEVIDLNALVAELDALLRRVIGEDLRLVTVFGASKSSVEANRGQLEQVVMNLAVNARDAMPSGGKLTIETAHNVLDEDAAGKLGVEPGSYVMLRVSDTGTGMDTETRTRIFEPFFTTKAPGRGTGLGLSTVYGIIKQAGGHIGVQSSPGTGTTFTIHLPVATTTAGEAAGETTEAPADRLSGTLLVAEDDDVLRGLIRAMLEQGGYDVLTARSGEEALEIAAAYSGGIDALVSDVIMPGMRGFELAARLRAQRPGIRVVFVTGYTGDAGEHDLLPGDTLLTKPFGMDALLGALGAVLPESARRAAP